MNFERDDYLTDPTGTSPLAYWKRHHPIPSLVTVVHEKDFDPEQAADCQVERYFRLVHFLSYVRPVTIPDGLTIRRLTPEDDAALIEQLNQAYHNQDIQVDQAKIDAWREFPVYYPEGWLGLFNGSELIASIICEYDEEIKEGIVDWLQVSPQYQGQGYGRLILTYALHILAEKADFVTVSGSLENQSNPEAVYRRCGFIGQDVWYVMVRPKE